MNLRRRMGDSSTNSLRLLISQQPITSWPTSRSRTKSTLFSVMMTALLLILSITASTAESKEVNMLSLAWLSQNGLLTDTEQYFASFMLLPVAMKHFNERDNTIIPDLSSRTKNCNATLRIFGGHIRDGRGLQNIAMRHLVEAHLENFEKPDIVHGPTLSDVAQTISMAAGALQIPVLSHTSTANLLSDKSTFPTFFRLVPSDTQMAEKIADLLVHFNYKRVGVIHTSDAYGISFRDAISDSCARRRIHVSSVFYEPDKQGEALRAQVKSSLNILVKQNISVIIKHVLLASHELAIAKAAFDLNWIKHKLYIGRRSALRELSTGEPFAREFARGQLAVVASYDESNPIYERLLRYMPHINVSFVNQFLPQNTSGLKPGLTYQLPNDFFTRTQSLEGMRFNAVMYDSIIAVGLAACDALAHGGEEDKTSPAATLFESLKKISFNGVTGRVQFDENQDRDSSVVAFGLENLVDNGTHIMRTIVGLTDERMNGQWNITRPIIFSDGTTIPPPDVVRAEAILDHLPLEAKIFGWIESGIGILLGLFTIGRLIYTHHVNSNTNRCRMCRLPANNAISEMNKVDSNNNNENDTNGVHDFFALKLILATATTALASSILPLTMESNLACSLFPWLFVLSLGVILLCLVIHAIQNEVLWIDGRVVDSRLTNEKHVEQITSITTTSPASTASIWLYRILFCGQRQVSLAQHHQRNQRSKKRPMVTSLSKEKAWLLLVLTMISFLLFSVILGGLIVVQLLVQSEWTHIILKRDHDGVPIVSGMGCVVPALQERETANLSASSISSEGGGGWIMTVFIVVVLAIGLLAMLTLLTSTWLKTYSKDDGASSKMSTLASLCVFQVFFVGLPTAATVWYAALSRFLVLSSVAFATCMIIFTTMFWTRFFCCCLQVHRWRLRPTQLPDPNLSSSFQIQLNNNNKLRQLRLIEIAEEREANRKHRQSFQKTKEAQHQIRPPPSHSVSSSQRLLRLLEMRMAGESIHDDENEADHHDGITPGMERRVPYSDEEDAKTTDHSRSSFDGIGKVGRTPSLLGIDVITRTDLNPSDVFIGEEPAAVQASSGDSDSSTGDGMIIGRPDQLSADVSPYSSAQSLPRMKRIRKKSLPSFVNLQELQATLSRPSPIVGTNVVPTLALTTGIRSQEEAPKDVQEPSTLAPILTVASPPPNSHTITTTTTSSTTSTSAATTTSTQHCPQMSHSPNNNGNQDQTNDLHIDDQAVALDLA